MGGCRSWYHMGTYTLPPSCSRTFSTDGTLKVISSSLLGPSRCLWSSCSGVDLGVSPVHGTDGEGCRGGEEGFLAGILFLHPVIWTAAELARDAHSMMASTSVSARAL